MTMRKLTVVLMVSGLLWAAAAAAEASKPKTVWKDPSGDADLGQGVGQSIPGGFDLASATIARNKNNLEFTVVHHDMPPAGSAPETFRFLWNISVGKEPYRFTVKSVDIGKPDVAGGQTTERLGRVDVQGHFRLEGACETVNTLPIGFVNCPPVAYLDGSWNPGEKSFTIILPLKTIKAKPGTMITQGADQICTICWVSHYAERSLSPTTVIDSTNQTVNYKVPKK
jgi:hypothetical protein